MSSNPATTLVTFLVRTPPDIRSVTLLGSWDNFSREYGMEKDKRMGNGYWRGCHIFTNIICDGQVKNTPGQGRDGALKMGGTYWYHYRLDDDVDFYNKAEPSTTSCPFLPGQPVNVLHVPINLPSGNRHHRRDSSTASLTSVNQTMNPEDKYMNPRPPPRPELPRLTTSPSTPYRHGPFTSPLTPPPQRTFHGRSFSHPRETQPPRIFRPGGKSSPDLRASEKEHTKANSIRTALLNFAYPRFLGKDSDWARVDSAEGRSPVRPHKEAGSQYFGVKNPPQKPPELCSNCSSPLRSPMRAPSQDDLRGRSVGKAFGPVDRQNAPICRDEASHVSQPRAAAHRPAVSPGIAADQRSVCLGTEPGRNADTLTITCKLDVCSNDLPASVDLNSKRLPTLPNSPSSVLDEEACARENCDDDELGRNMLQSRFSESTNPSPIASSPDVTKHLDGSHFSELTIDSDLAVSPSSMTSATTFNNDSDGEPYHTGHAAKHLWRDYENRHETKNKEPMSSQNGLNVSGLYITKMRSSDALDRNPQPNAHGHDVSAPALIQSQHDFHPPLVLRPRESRHYSEVQNSSVATLETPRAPNWYQENKNGGGDMRGMMQEMFDEMSYLAHAISSREVKGY